MTYALSGDRLTWNVAVPWAAEELGRLGNQRYITEDGGAGDPKGKLDRSFPCPLLHPRNILPSNVCQSTQDSIGPPQSQGLDITDT